MRLGSGYDTGSDAFNLTSVEELGTFSYTGKVIIVSFNNLFSCRFPFVRMVLQHNRLVCRETTEVIKTSASHRSRQITHESRGKVLTGSFNLFLCGFIPQMWESEDSVVILILQNKIRRVHMRHMQCKYLSVGLTIFNM